MVLLLCSPVHPSQKLQRNETCSKKCLEDRIKSETECKTDFPNNRTQFLNCSAENAIEYSNCLIECSPTPEEPEVKDNLSCDFLCTREHMRCEGLCRRYPFRDEWDRTECLNECDFESEVCSKMCEDSV